MLVRYAAVCLNETERASVVGFADARTKFENRCEDNSENQQSLIDQGY